MADRGSVAAFLWTPGGRRISLTVRGNAGAAARRIGRALAASDTVAGRVAGRGVKIERRPRKGTYRGAFATVFYGILQEEGEECLLRGHFQVHPVGRLFIGVWLVLSTALALTLLAMAALRASAQSGAMEALPLAVPSLLPLLGYWFAAWQRRKGRRDEVHIRRWLSRLECLRRR